jgi:diguanylate cyclase (GGDEF)-like protein
VLPETSLENAYRLAERLRTQIARTGFEYQGEKIAITASFGLTGFSAETAPEILQAEALLNRADKHLYQAKSEGRNRVVSAPFTS